MDKYDEVLKAFWNISTDTGEWPEYRDAGLAILCERFPEPAPTPGVKELSQHILDQLPPGAAPEPREDALALAQKLFDLEGPGTKEYGDEWINLAAAEIERYVESRLAAERERAEEWKRDHGKMTNKEFEAVVRAELAEKNYKNLLVMTDIPVIANMRDRMVAAEAEAKALKEAAKAYQDLCACYRLGKSPSESLWKRIEVARAALEGKP